MEDDNSDGTSMSAVGIETAAMIESHKSKFSSNDIDLENMNRSESSWVDEKLTVSECLMPAKGWKQMVL
eukprot:4478613-Ditylum_brightwellii.AAC.1